MVISHSLDTLIGYNLRRASNVMMADLSERLAELGLSTTEASILVALNAETKITQAEIGRRLSIKRANMAPLIARLVAQETIVRGASIGRAQPLVLSAKGKDLAERARARMDQHDAKFFGALSTHDRQHFHVLLSGIWRNGPV